MLIRELVLLLQELSILWIWIGFLKRFSVCWNGCFGTLLETKKVRMSKLIPCGNRKLFQPTVGTNWLVASLKLVIQFHHYRQLHLPFHLGTKKCTASSGTLSLLRMLLHASGCRSFLYWISCWKSSMGGVGSIHIIRWMTDYFLMDWCGCFCSMLGFLLPT